MKLTVRLGLLVIAASLGACSTLPASPPASNPVSGTASASPPSAPAVSAPQASVPPVATAAPAASAPSGNATAQPAIDEAAPVDPLRPQIYIDLDDRSAKLDLWTRIRGGFAMPDLDTDVVRSREQFYAANRDYVQRMTDRGSRYLFHIVEEVQRRKMPTELALLPFVESAFDPHALSRARASGMWQFMPQTGRVFELRQNVFRDDRRDVLASTSAALDYLGKLYGMFQDWHLALAAYNWGEGNVARAIARNKAAGLPTDYLSLRMPAETRQYVPKLQAIKNIILRPASFGLTLQPLENHPYFLAVRIERDIDVELAARLAGLSIDEFRSLNPQLNKPVLLAAGTPQILLPYDAANRFVKALAHHQGPTASWTAWTVPKTMKSAEAAAQAGMSDEGFRNVNHIPPRMLVKVGSTVVVPRGASKLADVSPQLADNASMALAPEAPALRKSLVRVGRGDSLAAMAKRHHVSAAQLAQWNKLSPQARLAPGMQLIVYTPMKTHVAAATRHGAKAHGTRRLAAAKGRKPAAKRVTKVAQNKAAARH